MKELQYDRIDSPIGTILLVVDDKKLCSLDYVDYEPRMMTLLQRRYGSVTLEPVSNPCGFSSRMRDYLAGDYASLDAIPVSTGGTAFQQEVWLALRSIPPGKTLTYGELAAQLGRPTAYRAVGGTNALNPVAIVLPCHRVIGASSSLTGYAGGLERKRWLLQHEGWVRKTQS
ncbi:MAG TPA: methylated-DNA--[protein]-cysteine S-methyltransferase [Ktedonobacteraceae bacterium]